MKLIAAAFILPVQQARRFLPAVILPLVMILLIQGWVYVQPDIQQLLANPYAVLEMSSGIVFKLLVLNLLLLMFTAMIGLNVMRLVLAASDEDNAIKPPALGLLERRFLWKFIQLILTFVVLYFVLALIASIIILPFTGIKLEATQPTPWQYELLMFAVAILPAFYFISRLSLILPATSLDQKIHFDRAWQLAEGNGIRMLLVLGAILLLSTLLGRLLPAPSSVVIYLLTQVVGTLLQIVLFVAIALAYQWLRQQEESYYQGSDEQS